MVFYPILRRKPSIRERRQFRITVGFVVLLLVAALAAAYVRHWAGPTKMTLLGVLAGAVVAAVLIEQRWSRMVTRFETAERRQFRKSNPTGLTQ